MKIKQALSDWLGTGRPLKFKSHWYYWHTGRKSLAMMSMVVSIAAMTLCFVLAAGYSIWGVIVAVLLDGIGFWLTLIYVFAVRSYIPELAQGQVDTLIATQLVLPMLLGFFISRISTYFVARAFASTANGSQSAMRHG